MDLHGSVTVAAPVEQVFDGWVALERAPEHQAASIERVRLDDGPLGVGSRFHAKDRWPGRTVVFEMELTEFERPSLVAARWEEPMNGSWRATFTPGVDGTRMDFQTTIQPSGLMGLLSPLMRPWAGRQLASGLESFRRWVETASAA